MKMNIKPRIGAVRSIVCFQRRRGQALIEMALVSTILIFLSMGIIQYGILYNAAIQLTNTAREGARYAGIHGDEDDVQTTTRNYIRTKVIAGTTVSSASLPDSNITVTKATDAAKGDPITVQITYDMTKKFFLPVTAWGGLANTNNRWSQYKSTATMIIE